MVYKLFLSLYRSRNDEFIKFILVEDIYITIKNVNMLKKSLVEKKLLIYQDLNYCYG